MYNNLNKFIYIYIKYIYILFLKKLEKELRWQKISNWNKLKKKLELELSNSIWISATFSISNFLFFIFF